MAYACETNKLRDYAHFVAGVLPEVCRDKHGTFLRMCVPGGDDATDERVGYFASKADAERSLRLGGFVPLTSNLWRYQSLLED